MSSTVHEAPVWAGSLMRHLVAGLPQDRWLLMTTADASDPARRLYASEGWRVVGPGIGEGRVIMARRRTA